ncbi:MAG TPA: glycoside hydrolase family 2 TIM barrel-domain containing protein [Anaerolineae bacterium]|nr:glycoside hydrolase family 2 TIM barrel-domain containing protein [Anaerolineae bacterium]
MKIGESDQPFILGVNYWPRRKAMYWWSQFEADEVREEFGVIAELGLGLVRIFLLWEDWQPTPGRVDPSALRNLETVCDIAASLGLELDVTFFTGHMSGPSWTPGWMLRKDQPMPARVRQVVSEGKAVNCGYANPFTDPAALGAAELLLRTVVSRLKGHPAVGLWNLGNEPDLFAWPPDAPIGRAWTRWMTSLIREIDPETPVTCGLHVANLIQDNGLRVNDVFGEVDIPVAHGYPMYVNWSTGPLDPDFVPFLCALTSALCGKPTLMEEFGGCTEAPGKPSSVWKWTSYGKPREQFMASEEELAIYIEQVLPRLVEVGATGAVVWCYADYAPELYGWPPCEESWHERFFGLVRPDGTPKPHAAVLKRFAEAKPRVQPAQRTVALDLPPETYYQNPLDHARRLYRQFIGQG